MKRLIGVLVAIVSFVALPVFDAQGAKQEGYYKKPVEATETIEKVAQETAPDIIAVEYTVGVGDMLDINVLKPEPMALSLTVAIDGSITFPYIGNVKVDGLTLGEVQNQIQLRLADGYMKYPVVSVSLRESRSKKFFVYGEVARPGTYLLEEKTTVLKAISMAGGFTKYGSSCRVKVLRPKKEGAGYETKKVDIGSVMGGSSKTDVVLEPQDIVVVSEGIF